MADQCPICRFPATFLEKEIVTIDQVVGAIYPITCQRCGSYRIKDRAKAYFEHPDLVQEGKRGTIASWISERKDFYIDEQMATRLVAAPAPSLSDRITRFLLYIFNNTKSIGRYITLDLANPEILNYTYSANQDELHDILDHLGERNHVSTLNESGYIKTTKITMDGMLFIEKNQFSNIGSTQGFVAMWFAPEMNRIYEEAIHPAIMAAGYNPIRVDQHEHNNDITDELIALIRRSKFVIADYTGHRGGVYYEAGFARGLGLEVFMTCRKDHMNELHFDVNHRICIEWTEDNLPDLKKQLANKIEATIGRGPIIHDA